MVFGEEYKVDEEERGEKMKLCWDLCWWPCQHLFTTLILISPRGNMKRWDNLRESTQIWLEIKKTSWQRWRGKVQDLEKKLERKWFNVFPCHCFFWETTLRRWGNGLKSKLEKRDRKFGNEGDSPSYCWLSGCQDSESLLAQITRMALKNFSLYFWTRPFFSLNVTPSSSIYWISDPHFPALPPELEGCFIIKQQIKGLTCLHEQQSLCFPRIWWWGWWWWWRGSWWWWCWSRGSGWRSIIWWGWWGSWWWCWTFSKMADVSVRVTLAVCFIIWTRPINPNIPQSTFNFYECFIS